LRIVQLDAKGRRRRLESHAGAGNQCLEKHLLRRRQSAIAAGGRMETRLDRTIVGVHGESKIGRSPPCRPQRQQ